ncbi:urease accessory protein [Novosphingobium sp. CF614]|uniref:HupE/UreJ family protein n=1 Tax=Novosphingobium sp. CF614 TaxID=1884364 RepID=UPI0008DFA818|nr:HupE/UreJ family protein [Novosphingobium sp. CF614]SFG31006.1 urease accessory protein [Novosphingobium sp. CF614]
MKRLTTPLPALAMAVLCGLVPETAMAHPGHVAAGFAAGLLHPLMGADHLAAMLLVGLGAAIFVKRGGWMLPATFLATLALGFATCTWLPDIVAEGGILVSLVTLGLAAALRIDAPAPLAMLAIGAFGYAHGASHGIETPQGAIPVFFAAGFLATSAVLHLGGYALSRVLPVPALRLIGAGGAGLGLVLAGLS